MATSTKNSSVRIIGGKWRGQRLPVAAIDGLRPSKDIVRETLFNWLQPVLVGSRCLDVFAGSGALGFEAASRGASTVYLLEKSVPLCEQLQQQVERLRTERITVMNVDAEDYLQQTGSGFDIVFLDPPFAARLLPQMCDLLLTRHWLNPGAQVYIEAARRDGLPELSSSWQWHKQKNSGDVVYGLAVIKA